nr:hypothetical protein [Tanacetum cinerariifolium]GEX50653.1 hypothetical protein [Tanacetum cinerariifolium]
TNIADLSTHTTRYISPTLIQKVFANIRRVGKGFSGVETPLFKSMLVVRDVAEEAEAHVPAQGDDVQEPAAKEVITEVVPPTPTSPSPPFLVLDTCSTLARRVEGLENDKVAQQLEIVKLKTRVKKLEKINKSREEIEEEDQEIIKSINETPVQKRNQKSVHGLALVKRWKLLTSYGVHVITFLIVKLFLLVERRYPLSRFTLEQLVNVARLQVKEESEMSLELLRFTRQQLQEYQQG